MHPLDGPRVRVERAKSQTVTLQACLQGFFNRYPYRVVVAEFNRKAGCHSLRVESAPPAFPNEWGVFIGEIAHNLRSALDGLAWQLALSETDVPYDRTAFPIYLVGHTGRKGRGGNPIPSFWGKGHGVGKLRSVPRLLWTRIEAFQPYKRGNGGRHSPLFLLDKLNNTDKHRLITVLAVTVAGMEITGLSGGTRIKVGVPLHMNAKVGCVRPLPAEGVPVLDIVNGHVQLEDGRIRTRMQYEMQVNTNITPGIRFGDSCDAVERLPVIRTLQCMANEVSRIIESFAGEFPK